jgi:hypothetical protein
MADHSEERAPAVEQMNGRKRYLIFLLSGINSPFLWDKVNDNWNCIAEIEGKQHLKSNEAVNL